VSDRFFAPDPPIDGRIALPDDEARHLARVLRKVPGDRVEVFDGVGHAYRAVVQSIGRDAAILADLEPLPAEPPPTCPLTLATAVPKGDRFDWLVEKATELGVGRLVPIVTDRSSVDPRAGKLDRLRRLIVEASKQCGRSRLMVLESPRPWADVRAGAAGFVAHPGGPTPSSWPPFDARRGAILAIGPEGGFTDPEVDEARAAGWLVVGLGPTVLRVETAAVVGAALVLAHAGRGGES
jgi:16S rRNA (uracil1498-N3)-methyltransferase